MAPGKFPGCKDNLKPLELKGFNGLRNLVKKDTSLG